jgi:hypothetical protein
MKIHKNFNQLWIFPSVIKEFSGRKLKFRWKKSLKAVEFWWKSDGNLGGLLRTSIFYVAKKKTML